MNLYRMPRLLPLSVLCAILATGCASSNPMVNTWRNPGFSPTPASTIVLKFHEHAQPGDAAMGNLLAAELQHEGFALTPEDRADYLLTYMVTGNLVEHDWVESSPPPAMPPSSQTYGQTATGPRTAYVYSQVEKSYVIPTRDIRLFLYTNPKTNPSGLQLVWQGTITVGKKHPAGQEPALLKTLLHYFGGDENGTVNLMP